MISSFPTIDLGTVATPPSCQSAPWHLTLNTGVVVRLKRFQQHLTYGNWLCGTPCDPATDVAEAITKANAWDRGFHDHPLVVPAPITRGEWYLPPLNDPPFPRINESWFPFAFLPPVTTFAEFHWDPGPECPEPMASALLIWWQEQFGLPVDGRVLTSIVNMDWHNGTKTWSP